MVRDNTHRRNPRKLGIVLIIVLSASLFPTQQLVFAHHDIFATHDRIQKAFGDIQKEYSGAGVQCGRSEKGFYIQNDEGCGTTGKLKDESWAEFGFASLSIDTEGNVAAHQREFTFLSSLYTDSNSPYYMPALVRDHNGVITSTVEGDKIHTRIWWGNLSLFSVFWGESTISGFNSLAKDQKTERISKIHNTAIKYAQKLEDKLLKYEAYDVMAGAPETAPSTPTPTPPQSISAKVQGLTGDVEYSQDGKNFAPLKAGTVIKEGWFVSTGFESTATLDFGYGTLRISQLTQLRIDKFVSEENIKKTQLFLNIGTVAPKLPHNAAIRGDFSVTTPTANASIRGSEMVVTYDETKRTTTVYATEDQAFVKGNSDSTEVTVKANQKVVVKDDGRTSAPQSFTSDELPSIKTTPP